MRCLHFAKLTPSLKTKEVKGPKTFAGRSKCVDSVWFLVFTLSLRNILVGVSVVGGTIQYCIKEKVLH